MGIGDILGRIGDVLTGRNDDDPQTQAPNQEDQILPASEDPLGDPADQGYAQNQYDNGGILPASEDPLGDPADQGYQQAGYNDEILPASMDPLGDPADTGGR